MNQANELVLSNFKTNSIKNRVPQQKLNDYTAWLMSAAQCAQEQVNSKVQADDIYKTIQKQFSAYAVSSDIIHNRYAMPVSTMLNNPEAEISLPVLYQDILTDANGANIDKRTHFFEKVVIDFLNECYPNFTSAPDEIVHVTSMGCIIPTPLQRFLAQQKWVNTTATNAYFFGCYASIPALRIAMGSLLNSQNGFSNQKQAIDIVHTEFLTIHMDSLNISPGNIISSTLFSDGFAKFSLTLNPDKNSKTYSGLKMIYLEEQIIENTTEEMKWEPGPYQFNLYLSKNIPEIVGQQVKQFTDKLMDATYLNPLAKEDIIFAIHPGGSKILDIVQEKLQLSDQQMKMSRDLLNNFGNMSSATLPYLWDQILNSDEIASGSKIVSLTFGPGMTAAGAVMEKI
jgi:alkylresorcinol/alkylpyrone synthase